MRPRIWGIPGRIATRAAVASPSSATTSARRSRVPALAPPVQTKRSAWPRFASNASASAERESGTIPVENGMPPVARTSSAMSWFVGLRARKFMGTGRLPLWRTKPSVCSTDRAENRTRYSPVVLAMTFFGYTA
jgi:hypothetical protein